MPNCWLSFNGEKRTWHWRSLAARIKILLSLLGKFVLGAKPMCFEHMAQWHREKSEVTYEDAIYILFCASSTKGEPFCLLSRENVIGRERPWIICTSSQVFKTKASNNWRVLLLTVITHENAQLFDQIFSIISSCVLCLCEFCRKNLWNSTWLLGWQVWVELSLSVCSKVPHSVPCIVP